MSHVQVGNVAKPVIVVHERVLGVERPAHVNVLRQGVALLTKIQKLVLVVVQSVALVLLVVLHGVVACRVRRIGRIVQLHVAMTEGGDMTVVETVVGVVQQGRAVRRRGVVLQTVALIRLFRMEVAERRLVPALSAGRTEAKLVETGHRRITVALHKQDAASAGHMSHGVRVTQAIKEPRL